MIFTESEPGSEPGIFEAHIGQRYKEDPMDANLRRVIEILEAHKPALGMDRLVRPSFESWHNDTFIGGILYNGFQQKGSFCGIEGVTELDIELVRTVMREHPRLEQALHYCSHAYVDWFGAFMRLYSGDSSKVTPDFARGLLVIAGGQDWSANSYHGGQGQIETEVKGRTVIVRAYNTGRWIGKQGVRVKKMAGLLRMIGWNIRVEELRFEKVTVNGWSIERTSDGKGIKLVHGTATDERRFVSGEGLSSLTSAVLVLRAGGKRLFQQKGVEIFHQNPATFRTGDQIFTPMRNGDETYVRELGQYGCEEFYVTISGEDVTIVLFDYLFRRRGPTDKKTETYSVTLKEITPEKGTILLEPLDRKFEQFYPK